MHVYMCLLCPVPLPNVQAHSVGAIGQRHQLSSPGSQSRQPGVKEIPSYFSDVSRFEMESICACPSVLELSEAHYSCSGQSCSHTCTTPDLLLSHSHTTNISALLTFC